MRHTFPQLLQDLPCGLTHAPPSMQRIHQNGDGHTFPLVAQSEQSHSTDTQIAIAEGFEKHLKRNLLTHGSQYLQGRLTHGPFLVACCCNEPCHRYTLA